MLKVPCIIAGSLMSYSTGGSTRFGDLSILSTKFEISRCTIIQNKLDEMSIGSDSRIFSCGMAERQSKSSRLPFQIAFLPFLLPFSKEERSEVHQNPRKSLHFAVFLKRKNVNLVTEVLPNSTTNLPNHHTLPNGCATVQ